MLPFIELATKTELTTPSGSVAFKLTVQERQVTLPASDVKVGQQVGRTVASECRRRSGDKREWTPQGRIPLFRFSPFGTERDILLDPQQHDRTNQAVRMIATLHRSIFESGHALCSEKNPSLVVIPIKHVQSLMLLSSVLQNQMFESFFLAAPMVSLFALLQPTGSSHRKDLQSPQRSRLVSYWSPVDDRLPG